MASETVDRPGLPRRDFARLLTVGGAAVVAAARAQGWSDPPPLGQVPAEKDEKFWTAVRAQFLMPPSLTSLNAANLCPASLRVVDAMFASTRSVEQDPSSQNRQQTQQGREEARRRIAQALRVTPEEIVIARNTSEANNIVSSGLDLRPPDEVLIFSDNHPSNHAAWREKAKRFGYTVTIVEQVNPHPGPDYYIGAFTKAITPKTKVLAFTHVTSSVGDLMPAKELCRLARERGVLTLVDGAQSFGVLDVDLADMQPDFYSGSAHKWPCGPKETGVLYVNARAHALVAPSVISLYAGAVGISRTLEAYGQRDEPAIIGFSQALAFQGEIGRKVIEERARELTAALIEGLRTIDGVKVWTHPARERSAAIVSFQPAALDVRKLNEALYRSDQIVCSTRAGADRGGLRLSPHFYNTHAEIDRTLAAVARYVRAGL